MTGAGSQADATLRLHEMAYSLGVSAALLAAVELGIPDAIGDSPVRVDDLAKELDAHPGALRQLLRALAGLGVFCAAGEDTYSHSALSRALQAQAPRTRRPWVLLAGAPFAWQAWPKLSEAVRTGRSVFPGLYGKDLFAYLNEDEPEIGAVFNQAMATSAAAAAAAVAASLDVRGTSVVADIGGGRGILLRALLERHKDLRGVLFDLPQVVADADPALRHGGTLASRCSIAAGDCRRAIGVAADLYLLKGVIHMWDDETATLVLRNVRASAPAGARVVIMDQMLDASPTPRIAAVMDLLMLITQGGKERTEQEFRCLLDRAGLVLRGIAPAGPVMHLITAQVTS